jgi:lysophospholipase L1-like esterase
VTPRSTAARRLLALAAAVLLLIGLASVTAPKAAHSATPDAWCSALAAGNPAIDVLGDSVSIGDAVADPAQRWHAQLRDSLRSDGAPNADVWTGGAIGGSATADYQPGAKYWGHIQFTANHPDLILMGWGINDWVGPVPLSVFRQQYQQIIDSVHALSPGSTLVLMHTPWVYNADLLASHGPQWPYRDAIRELADLNGAFYVGLEWFFPGDNRYNQSIPDRVHLNANGQNTMYTALRSYFLGLCAGGAP